MLSKELTLKKNLFNKLFPFLIGIYILGFVLVPFLCTKIFPGNALILFLGKGAIFSFFALIILIYSILNKDKINFTWLIPIACLVILNIFVILIEKKEIDLISVWHHTNLNIYYVNDVHLSITKIDVLQGLMSCLTTLFTAYFLICLYPPLLQNKNNFNIIFYSVSCCMLLAYFYCALFERTEIVSTFKSFISGSDSNIGVASVFENKNTFGLVTFAFIIYTLIAFFKYKIKLSILFFIISNIFLGITFCKTSIILALILYATIGVFLFIKLCRRNKKLFFVILGAILFLTVLLIISIVKIDFLNSIWKKIGNLFVDYGSLTVKSRFENWKAAFQSTNGSSILFGSGEKLSFLIFEAYGDASRLVFSAPTKSCHNGFLEIFIQGGIIWLLFYIYLFIRLFNILRKNKISKIENFILFIGLIIFILNSCFESMILVGHSTISFFMSIALVSPILSLNTTKPNNLKNKFSEIINKIRTDYITFFLTIIFSAIVGLLLTYAGYCSFYANYVIAIILIVVSILVLVTYITLIRKKQINYSVIIANIVGLIFAGLILLLITTLKHDSILIGTPVYISKKIDSTYEKLRYVSGINSALYLLIFEFIFAFIYKSKKFYPNRLIVNI